MNKTPEELKSTLNAFSSGGVFRSTPDKERSRTTLDAVISGYDQPSRFYELVTVDKNEELTYTINNVLRVLPVNFKEFNLLKFDNKSYFSVFIFWMSLYISVFSFYVFAFDNDYYSGKEMPKIVIISFLCYFFLRGIAALVQKSFLNKMKENFSKINSLLNNSESVFGNHIQKHFYLLNGGRRGGKITIQDLCYNYLNYLNEALELEDVDMSEVKEFNKCIVWFTLIIIVNLILTSSAHLLAFNVAMTSMALFNTLYTTPSADYYVFKAALLISLCLMGNFYHLKDTYNNLGIVTFSGWKGRQVSKAVSRFFNKS